MKNTYVGVLLIKLQGFITYGTFVLDNNSKKDLSRCYFERRSKFRQRFCIYCIVTGIFFNKRLFLNWKLFYESAIIKNLKHHIKERVLLNRVPTSTQLHPPPPSSTQLHQPPLSSFQPLPSFIHLHPAHFSLHPVLCNTLNNI